MAIKAAPSKNRPIRLPMITDHSGVTKQEITRPKTRKIARLMAYIISAAKYFDINKELAGADITVTDAEISPISMRINYTVSADMEANEDEIGIPEMKGVILKDGTRIPYLADGGNVGYTDATHAYHITGYDRVVDVDEIQSLLLWVKPGEEPVSVDIQ